MDVGPDNDYLIKYHGWMMTTAFGVIFPAGVALPIIFKGTSYWPIAYQLHRVVQILGTLFIIAGVALGAKLSQEEAQQHIHKAIGIAVFTLILLQVILTLTVRPVLHGKARGLYNVCHWWGGRTALVVGVGNAYYGLKISHPDTRYWVGFSVAIGGILLIAVLGQLFIHAVYYSYDHEGHVVLHPTFPDGITGKRKMPAVYQHVVAKEIIPNGNASQQVP